MSTALSTFDLYVRTRLDAWGREFALHRDCEYLGHQSRSLLQVLIEHKGEMPPRVTGFRPLTIPLDEEQIERIVSQIARDAPLLAIVLRAYYCGSGRRGVERLEIAESLSGRKIKRRLYFTCHDLAFQRVAGALSAQMAKAA